MRDYPAMTLEGELLARWRKHLGLSQQRLAECIPGPGKVTRTRIGDIERRDSSVTVNNLLRVIRGLERGGEVLLGKTDRRKLVRFFEGPDFGEAQTLLRSSAKALLALSED